MQQKSGTGSTSCGYKHIELSKKQSQVASVASRGNDADRCVLIKGTVGTQLFQIVLVVYRIPKRLLATFRALRCFVLQKDLPYEWECIGMTI